MTMICRVCPRGFSARPSQKRDPHPLELVKTQRSTDTCSHGGWIQTQNMNSGKLDNTCTWLCFAYSLYLVVTSMASYPPQNQLKSKKCLKQSQSVVCPVRHVIANGVILTNALSFQLLPSHSYQQCFQTLLAPLPRN